MGRPHRYGYAVALEEKDSIIGAESMLVCHDFERGTSVERSFGRGALVGEAVFVPRAPDADEADGWLLTLAYSPETDTSALHIVNAGDPTGDAQAVVELPQRVPVGFHGNWVPDTP